MINGIDISNNQPNVDFAKVHAAGQRFVFMKVNEGDYIDKVTSRARVLAAKKVGLLVGGYDFARPRKGRSGGQEFDIFYKRAKEVGLVGAGCLRPVLDIEATGFSGRLGAYNTRRYVKSWIKRCVAVTGRKPLIYTGSWFWDSAQMKGSKDTTQGCKLWLAAYVPAASRNKYIPNGFDHISIWQYTDKAKVAGVPGNCDANMYLGNIDSLRHTHTL